MKKYIFLFLALFSVSAFAQDCDELPKRTPSVVFPTSYAATFDGINKYITAADHNDFSFTNGSGQDLAFSWVIFMNRTSTGTNSILMEKFNEIRFFLIGSTVYFLCWDAFPAHYIGRSAPMSTTGTYIGLAVTYTGNESQTGIKIYVINPGGSVTQIDNANFSNGAYSGMANNVAPMRIGGSLQNNLYFDGKLAHPLVVNKALSVSELEEIAAMQNGDYRKLSFFSNIVSAWRFQDGQNSYPTTTDYISGHNGTMTNMQATDIVTEAP